MVYDPTLPAGSTLGKSYEYGVDVEAILDSGTWAAVRRALNVVPGHAPVTQTAQTYDDKGSPNADVAGWTPTLTLSTYVNRSASTGALVPELKALFDRIGDKVSAAATIRVRWYHKPADGSTPDPTDAWMMTATVGLTRANTGPEGTNELWNWTLTGKGPATRITNPFTGWVDDTADPVIVAITPAGQSVGEQIRIDGQQFDGATSVTIDALAAQFTIVNSATIIATIPATAAGAADVIVTTPGGVSAAVSYTVV